MKSDNLRDHTRLIPFTALIWLAAGACGGSGDDFGDHAASASMPAMSTAAGKLSLPTDKATSTKLTRRPKPLPFPLPGPEEDWTSVLGSWNAGSGDVSVDADTPCFAVLRATKSASQVSCMAWNKSSQPGQFQMIRWYAPPTRDVPPQVVHEFPLGSNELRRVSVGNIYPARGEDEFRCVLRLDDVADCDDDRVSLAMVTEHEDDPHVLPASWFRRNYCDTLGGMGRHLCETDGPRRLEILSDAPALSATAHAWNRSYHHPVTARLQYREPCDSPRAWRGAAGEHLGAREVTHLSGSRATPVYWRLIVLPDKALDIYDPRSDIVIAGSLGYDPQSEATCEPTTPDCEQGAECDVTPPGCHRREDFEVEGETLCGTDGTETCYARHGEDYCSIPGGRCGGGEGHVCDFDTPCAPGFHCVGFAGEARCERVCEVDLAFCWTPDEAGNALLPCGS